MIPPITPEQGADFMKRLDALDEDSKATFQMLLMALLAIVEKPHLPALLLHVIEDETRGDMHMTRLRAHVPENISPLVIDEMVFNYMSMRTVERTRAENKETMQ